MQPGYILIFKGQGFIFRVLSWLLKQFEKGYVAWGWHLAIAVEYHKQKGWLIAESIAGGVTLSWLDQKKQHFRSYKWFDQHIHSSEVRRFIADRAGCSYDVGCYFWTMLQYLVLHFLNHSLPRVLNRRYSCWELIFEFCREMGKPLQPLHRYPLISDFMKGMKSQKTKHILDNNDEVPYDRFSNYAERMADL